LKLTAGASTFMLCLDEELNKEEKNKQDGNKKKKLNRKHWV